MWDANPDRVTNVGQVHQVSTKFLLEPTKVTNVGHNCQITMSGGSMNDGANGHAHLQGVGKLTPVA